jgi:hypothetical protein
MAASYEDHCPLTMPRDFMPRGRRLIVNIMLFLMRARWVLERARKLNARTYGFSWKQRQLLFAIGFSVSGNIRWCYRLQRYSFITGLYFILLWRTESSMSARIASNKMRRTAAKGLAGGYDWAT